MANTVVPLFPLRSAVVLPGTPHVFEVARDRSILALQAAHKSGDPVFCVAQSSEDAYNPGPNELCEHGTIAVIQSLVRLPSAALKVTLLASRRARLVRFVGLATEFPRVEVDEIRDVPFQGDPRRATAPVKEAFAAWAQGQSEIETPYGTKMAPPAAIAAIGRLENPGVLSDAVASFVPLPFTLAQTLVRTTDAAARLDALHRRLAAVTGASVPPPPPAPPGRAAPVAGVPPAPPGAAAKKAPWE